MTILFDSAKIAQPSRKCFARGVLASHPHHVEPYTEADRQWAADHFGNLHADPSPDCYPDEASELPDSAYFFPEADASSDWGLIPVALAEELSLASPFGHDAAADGGPES